MRPHHLCFAIAALTTSIHSQAAFVLTLDDPNTLGIDVIIGDDALPGTLTDSGLTVNRTDLIGGAGVVSFSGSVGAFVVNVTTGVSQPLIGPSRLDLNSIDISGAPGTLFVSLTNTDFTYPTPTFNFSHAGETDGNVSIQYRYDANNQEFGGSVFASASHVTATDPTFAYYQSNNVPAAGLYSLSIVSEINHSGAGQVTKFSSMISPVPVPAAFWLFGSALAGLAGLRRFK